MYSHSLEVGTKRPFEDIEEEEEGQAKYISEIQDLNNIPRLC